MLRYILKRLLMLIPVILIVSLLVYTLLELAPGTVIDPLITEAMTDEDIQALRVQFNLDRPMIYRYGLYMLNFIRGDLGVSDVTGISVWDTFMSRLPYTIMLAAASTTFACAVGIPLGIFASKRAGKLSDSTITGISIVGMSMPNFWMGILFLLFFSMRLGLFPAAGAGHGLRGIILPAITQGSTLLAIATRQTRSSMLEVLRSDYLRTARAKGVPEETVIRKHALGNAWIPIITQIGISLGVSLAGAAVVETVFAWPGIGRLVVEAVRARDTTEILGVTLLTTILFVLIQLAVDLVYAFVDPRVKSQYVTYRKKKKSASGAKNTASASALTEVQIAEKTQAARQELLSVQDNNWDELESNDDSYALDEAFVTRNDASWNEEESEIADPGAIMKMYKKRSRLNELMHRLIQNKGAVAGLFIFGALFITFLFSLTMSWHEVNNPDVLNRFISPNAQFPFGTDNMGRDMFQRTIFGMRYSLVIGFGAVLLGGIFGVALGSIAGYFGGKVDDLIMRFSDVMSSIPGHLLGMVIMVMLGPSIPNLIIAVGVGSISSFLRVTRASLFTVRNNEFVEAAKATGLGNTRIMYTQVLPNGLAPIIVHVSVTMGMTILVASSLSFLGFGLPIPTPEWGALISGGREFLRHAPWITTFPGIFLMITVLAMNLLGDGLRDALDPKLKK